MPRAPWSIANDTLFATLVAPRGHICYHLIAERLPADDGWDWTVWRPGDAREAARHGSAPDAATAMMAAEGAARHWDTG